MELVVEPDIYEPNVDNDGNYIDYIPSSTKFINGIRCPCGSRKEHLFYNKQSFSIHNKSKAHQRWITELNSNKKNYFVENVKLNELVSNQKIIIAKLQKENIENLKCIAYLTKKIEMKDEINDIQVVDLLNFD